MRIFMRIVLTLYILFVIIVAGITLACTWMFIAKDFPANWLDMLYTDANIRLLVSVIGVAVILISVALMFSGIRKRRPKTAFIADTGSGSVLITINALEEMAIRHMLSSEAVRTVKAKVKVRDAKANITGRLAVAEGTNIPETLTTLQKSLTEHIETLAGIKVGKISLLVEKTSQIAKARVE
jgi:Protein of unknown function (DUF322).